MTKTFSAIALAAVLAGCAACNNGSVTPTGPTGSATTDAPYSGITGPGTGTVGYFFFSATQAGEIDFTLTQGQTASGLNIPLDVEIGVASGTTCGLQADMGTLQIGGTTVASVNSQATGSLCGAVIDEFDLGPANWTLLVTHY